MAQIVTQWAAGRPAAYRLGRSILGGLSVKRVAVGKAPLELRLPRDATLIQTGDGRRHGWTVVRSRQRGDSFRVSLVAFLKERDPLADADTSTLVGVVPKGQWPEKTRIG